MEVVVSENPDYLVRKELALAVYGMAIEAYLGNPVNYGVMVLINPRVRAVQFKHVVLSDQLRREALGRGMRLLGSCRAETTRAPALDAPPTHARSGMCAGVLVMPRLIVSKPSRIYVRRGGVVRVRGGIDGEELVVDSTIDSVLVVSSRVSITSSAIRVLSNMGVDVVFLARNGEPVARVYPPVINRTVMTRRAQYEALLNGRGGIHVARVVTRAKIMNQANLLRYVSKSRRVDSLRDEAVKLDELAMGLEGGLATRRGSWRSRPKPPGITGNPLPK